MILRFGCENFRSIGDYQEVLMTASKLKAVEHDYLISQDNLREHVLPIVAIYGANASGKTNIIKAIRYMIGRIIFSDRSGFNESDTNKFKLLKSFQESPSIFDIDFFFNGSHYHYGFAIDDNKVIEEWLYTYSYGKRISKSLLFERFLTDDGYDYNFGKSLKGRNKTISDITSEDSLFISTAAKSNHDLISNIVEYFKESYSFRFKNELNERSIARKVKNRSVEIEISKFLSMVDIGATRIEVSEVEIDDDQKKIMSDLNNVFKSFFEEKEFEYKVDLDDKESVLHVFRSNSEGKEVSFSLSEESLGTKSLISLLASVFLVLKKGGVFIVDELESSLHTLLSLRIVELFNNIQTNPNGAQVIFTTHETHLLNFEGVRKDEIWLTEKCKNGSTKISPLSDYSIGKNSNIRKGYLEGRFGAIPFLSQLDIFKLADTIED